MRFTALCAFTALAVTFSTPRPASAAGPATIAFQGALTGVANGARSATFKIYGAASSGTALWTETKTITVTSGRFATALGDTTAFPASLLFDAPYWVGVTIGADPEMIPRLPLASVPYALALPNVFVNRVSGRVGIGTTSPQATLDVAGSVQASDSASLGSSVLEVGADGNGTTYVTNLNGFVRVQLSATTSAGGRVDVDNGNGVARTGLYVAASGDGTVYTDQLDFANVVGQKIRLYGDDPTSNYGLGIQSGILQIHGSSSGASIVFGYGGSTEFTEKVRITGAGRVGIGTPSPTQASDVRGNIKMNSAGDMYAAGGTENLYIVRGLVDSAGSIVTGSGYTVSRTATGRYTITFTSSEFDQPPTVTVTPWTSEAALAVVPSVAGTVGQPATFRVYTYLNGVAKNYGFSFIATANH